MNLKIGDRVIVERGHMRVENPNYSPEYGRIVEIRYYKDPESVDIKGHIHRNKSDDVYFYAVKDEKDKSTQTHTYNVFSFDSIQLDVEKTREDKLKEIGI